MRRSERGDGPGAADASTAMDRYARGDAAAFGEVYDLVGPRVLGFVRRRVRDPVLAEDFTQQTFLQMHAARATYVQGSDVVAWALAIARFLVIDRERRAWREVHMAAPDAGASLEDGPDEQARTRQDLERLMRALAQLPEKQREAFQLLKLDELSQAQAAELLGVTVTAVKLRLHRANEALRKILGDDGDLG